MFFRLIKRKLFFLIFLLLIIIIIFVIGYFFINENKIPNKKSSSRIINPIEGLSSKEAIERFDERFVYYLLVSIRAYRLHAPLLSEDIPKINFYIGEDIYNAEIKEGKIIVDKGEIFDSDIIIRTSKEEAVRMMLDRTYIESSFNSGKSSIEFIASKLELFSKGYLNIYEGLTGKSLSS